MKHLNFLSTIGKAPLESSSSDIGRRYRVVTDFLPSFCRVNMLKFVSILTLFLIIGAGNVWGTNADVGDALWSEDFSSFSNGDKPSTHSGTGWGSASITYSQGNNDTKAYTGQMSAGGTSPELLIKPNDSWTISGIPTGGATEMALSFKSNRTTFAVTTSTADLTITGSGKSWTITVKEGKATPSTFNLAVRNSGTNNARVDNVELVVVTAAAATGCTGQKLGTPVVTAEASSGQVELTWPTVSNASSYQLKWNGGEWASATSPVVKTGLSNGTAYTYQVKAIGNGSTYCDGDASTEASAIPNVYHTVTWNNHGNTTTSLVVSGEKPTFPATPSSCDLTCTTFYGWATSAWSGPITSLTGKTIYLKASDMPDVTEDVTYYAVYSDASVTEYTFNSLSWGATSGGSAANWTSGKDANGFTSGQGVQVTSAKTGANATSPTSFTNVSRIVVTYNTNKGQGAGSIEMKIGTNSSVTNNVAWQSGDDGTCANYTTTFSYATTQSGNVKLTTNCTTNSIWVKSIEITSGAATQHYLTSCCTSLGQINGSLFLVHHF